MNYRSFVRLASSVVCALCILLTQKAYSTVYYWDPTGSTATATPTGTWDSSTANWSTANTLTATPVAWSPGVAACFCAGTSATGTFTVTLDTTQSCAGIFNGGLTPPGCFVTISGAGALDLASGQDAFNAAGANGGTTTVAVPLIGVGTVTLEGSKSVYFTATNTYSGGTQLGYSSNPFSGTIFFNNSSSFGTGSIQMVSASNMMSLQGSAAVTLSNSVTTTSTILNITGNPAGLTFAGAWSLGATTPTIGCAGTGNLVTIAGAINGSGSISKYGPGTLKLAGPNIYTGATTISNGPLALSGGLSTSRINIYPGANGSVFDVSAISAYTLNGIATLFAAGTGTATTTEAAIKGASGGTVSFGTRPIILNFTPTGFAGDTTHPPLYVTQGAITFNNNTITVTNAAATALGTGTYRLMQVSSATINGSPNPTVSVLGSGIVSNTAATLVVSSGQLNLVIKPKPAFTNITVSQTTAAGVGVQTVTISGTVSAGSTYPQQNENVTVNLNGAVQVGKVFDATGDFSATFNVSSIPYLATNYPVTFSYTGDTSLAGVTNSTIKIPANWFFNASALAGFFGGENMFTTNTAGINMYCWSSTNAYLPVSDWYQEGQMTEQPLNDGSGKSRYSFLANPTVPLTYYILGPSVTWPYASPTSAQWITNDDQANQTFFTTNVAIGSNGALNIPAPPVILVQPTNQTVVAGKNVTFNCVITGNAGLVTQWYYNGANASGQTSGNGGTITFTNVTTANAGTYTLFASNSLGTATSDPATLTVLNQPQMGFQPAASSGGTVELSAIAAPSEKYFVQTTTDLTPPAIWFNIATNFAGTNGVIDFIDTNSTVATNLYYRLQFP
jgi:autotransporter-associated beta strand protein